MITRIICNLSLFGFPVIMPLFYTSPQIGFTLPQWALIWGTFFLVQPVTNVVWGLIGDRIGWMRQMRWFGFVGCGTASLLFYWLPSHFPHNMMAATIAALLFAFTVTSFVPMGAIFPMMEPEHKGAAVSVQNLGGGLANFGGPMIAAVILPDLGIQRSGDRLWDPLLLRRSPDPVHPRRSAQRHVRRIISDTLITGRARIRAVQYSDRLDIRHERRFPRFGSFPQASLKIAPLAMHFREKCRKCLTFFKVFHARNPQNSASIKI